MFRRSLYTFAAVLAASGLALGFAVPSYAADATGKPRPAQTSYSKYWDHRMQTWERLEAEGKVQPVNKGVHPSSPATGRQPALTTNGKPLVGRVIQPGRTPVLPPSIFNAIPNMTANAAKYLATGKFLGMATTGMGGKMDMPKYALDTWKAKSAASQACKDGISSGAGGCTEAQKQEYLDYTTCHISTTKTCESLGVPADPADEPTGLSVAAFLQNLWEDLTGQSDEGEVPNAYGHFDIDPKGCHVTPVITGYDGGERLTSTASISAKPRPSSTSPGIYWDQDCAGAGNAAEAPAQARILTTCVDSMGRTTNAAGTAPYGVNASAASLSYTGGKSARLCNPSYTTEGQVKLVELFVISEQTQAYHNGATAVYSASDFMRWINPDPSITTDKSIEIGTDVTCTDPGGSTRTFTIRTVGTGGFPEAACPDGWFVKEWATKSRVPGSGGYTGGAPTTIGGGSLKPDAPTKYADCLAGPGCGMEVYVDGQPCTVGAANCVSWSQIRSKQPSRVTCMWGGHTMAASDCNVLAEAYKTETGVVYDPHSDSFPAIDTEGNPVPQPNPTPWNPTNPNPTPGTDVGTPVQPDTGTGTPGFPTTGTNPDTGTQNCMPGGWSWNPVDWVLKPLQCAFVPTVDVKAKLGGIGDSLMAKPPFSWVNVAFGAPTGGGCPNWVVSVAGLSKNVVCESSFTGAILGARGPLFGLVATAMVWPLIRSIWYGLIPIVRAVPTK